MFFLDLLDLSTLRMMIGMLQVNSCTVCALLQLRRLLAPPTSCCLIWVSTTSDYLPSMCSNGDYVHRTTHVWWSSGSEARTELLPSPRHQTQQKSSKYKYMRNVMFPRQQTNLGGITSSGCVLFGMQLSLHQKHWTHPGGWPSVQGTQHATCLRSHTGWDPALTELRRRVRESEAMQTSLLRIQETALLWAVDYKSGQVSTHAGR